MIGHRNWSSLLHLARPSLMLHTLPSHTGIFKPHHPEHWPNAAATRDKDKIHHPHKPTTPERLRERTFCPASPAWRLTDPTRRSQEENVASLKITSPLFEAILNHDQTYSFDIMPLPLSLLWQRFSNSLHLEFLPMEVVFEFLPMEVVF